MPRSARISCFILLGCVIICSLFFFNSREDTSRYQSTDDAYVRADATRVSPQIYGKIITVAVEENQPVKAGELLAVIDDREFVLQVATARAELESSIAAHKSLEEKLVQQESTIAQAKATVDADKATVELNRQEFARYRNLAADGSGSRQALQKATSAYKVSQANLARDNARYEAEKTQVGILQADLRAAAARIEQARAALELAELNVSYCRIYAPIDGVVSQKSVRLGAYVRTGESLLAVVPLHDIYVDAYFRETQLANIREGQPVSISVDAFPGRTFAGIVASLGPASNASFSPIAPHSTSSNFTKIVQRLPVRIAVTDAEKGMLKVGMSVIVNVDTDK